MLTEEMDLQDTYHRMTLLSFTEICFYLGRYDESNDILLRLQDHFRTGSSTAKTDQQRHIRAVLLLAQHQHRQAMGPTAWRGTRDLWRDSINLTRKYEVLSTSGSDYAIMCLSLHHVLRMIPQKEQSDGWLQRENNIFLLGSEDYVWMRNLSTNWVTYILRQDLRLSDRLRSRIMTCARSVQVDVPRR